VVAAFVVGALVAGIQLMPVLWNVAGSARWQEWESGERPPAATLLDVALRVVLPDLFGHPADGTWWGPFNSNATAVFAGIVTLPLAVAGAVERWRDPRMRGVLVASVAAALAAYQVFPVRELLLLMPGVSHMLHHRLLFAVDLGVALLAGAGLAALARGRARGLGAAIATVLAALVVAWARHHEAWREAALVAQQVGWTAWAIAALGALSVAARLARRPAPAVAPRAAADESASIDTPGAPHANGVLPPPSTDALARAIAVAAIAAVAGELVVAHARTNPGLAVESLLPRTPAIDFLGARDGRIAAIGAALRPNAAIVHRLRDVRGDDTLKSARYERVYRSFGGASPYFFEPVLDWEHRWLDELGVRWVLAAPATAPPVTSWTIAYDGPDARVFERASALPLVRWSDGGTEGIAVTAAEPGGWKVSFHADRPRVLVVAESWDEGWSGTVSTGAAGDGGRAALAPEREALVGARVGPGAGELRLRHRPRGFALGAAASGLGVLLLLVAAVRQRRHGATIALAEHAPSEAGVRSAARPRRGTRR
jgi:hypothetical protein